MVGVRQGAGDGRRSGGGGSFIEDFELVEVVCDGIYIEWGLERGPFWSC